MMDTKAVAAHLGTEPKILRRFLRDPQSTFKAVGSGSRYEFTASDLPEVERRFNNWLGTKTPRTTPIVVVSNVDRQADRDREVWAEEQAKRDDRGLGPLVLDDLRDPRVQARVRAKAGMWERRLNERLMAAGLHISQMRDRVVAA